MDAVEDIKQRLNIEDVVSEYVQLKRAGRNYKALSPFTNEKTASFIVSPEKQIWHDFSSGKGGNVFSFVMEVEGLDFKGALELLARKAGVDLEQYRSSSSSRKAGPDKERLYELLELAAKFYQVQLSHSQTTLSYVFTERGFSKDTALAWRLGYSPNTGSALLYFAKKKGFSEKEVKLAGLSSQNYRGSLVDMFRGRLMIPLADAQGRVIGFTARILDNDPNAPKYINTPQTILYDKSRHIFGLHLAKEAIRKNKFAVMVEGNLDVIASHQAGVRQVVATAGTALTEPHLKTLSRLTGDIRLCFDADRAGVAATERAIPLASKTKVSLSIISLRGAKDPDELIRQDPKAWVKAIDSHEYALDWLIERYSQQLDITTAQGKREFSDVLLPVVRSLADDVEKDHYMTLIADAIKVNRGALESKLQKTGGPSATATLRRIKATSEKPDKVTVENLKAQDNFLSLMLARPTLRELMDLIEPEMLFSEEGRELLEFLKSHPDYDGKSKSSKVQKLSDYVKIESLLYEELYHGLELNELHNEAARLQVRLVEQFIKTEKQRLAIEIEKAASDADTLILLGKAKQYDNLLNKLKERRNFINA